MTFAAMPIPLRRYVVAVALGAPLLVLAVVLAWGGERGDAATWLQALLLTVLVAVFYGRPLQVGHRHSYDVSELGHVAMILLLPVWLPGILVGVAGAAHLLRRSRRRVVEVFNVAQVMVYVTAGAVVFAALEHRPEVGPALGEFRPGAVAAASVVLLLVNVALVAGVVSLQTSARFWRLFRSHLASLAAVYTALVALGVVAALVVRDYPLALAPLVLPAALAQSALRREVQLRADTREALARLVDVVELRDPYTAGHSVRVASIARAVAERMGLPAAEADLVETAGRVHDLGKVAMDADLFTKQGPLSAEEWIQVRRHPVHGADIVERFAGYRGCAPLVRHHHERWDGGGYPAGLAGDAIPLGARILAVADSWDAMTSARAYRPPMGDAVVLTILEEGAGVQWDPRVVRAFVEWQRETAAVADPVPAASPVPA